MTETSAPKNLDKLILSEDKKMRNHSKTLLKLTLIHPSLNLQHFSYYHRLQPVELYFLI